MDSSPARSDSEEYGIDLEAAETSCVSYNRFAHHDDADGHNSNNERRRATTGAQIRSGGEEEDEQQEQHDTNNNNTAATACCCSSCCSSFCSGADRHCNLVKNHFSAFYGPNIGVALATAIFGTLLPISLRQLSESDAIIGLVVSLAGLGRIIAEVPVSIISQKFGPKRIMIVSIVFVIGSFILPVIENTTKMFVVANAVGGLAIAGFATPRHEMIREVFQKGERNVISSHMGAVGRISFLIGPTLGGVFYSHFGYRYGYGCAVLWIILTLVCLAVSPEMRHVDEKLRREQHEHDEAKKKLKTKQKASSPDDGGSTSADKEAPLLQHASSGGEGSSHKNDGDSNIGSNGEEDVAGSSGGGLVSYNRSSTSYLSAMDIEDVEKDERAWQERHSNQQASINYDDDDDYAARNLIMAGTPSMVRLPWNSLYDAEEERRHDDDQQHQDPTERIEEEDEKRRKKVELEQQQQHRDKEKASVLEAICHNWRTVVSVGMMVLSIMAIRQARRLTIQLRALNLGFNGRDVGFVLAGSFAVDTIFFWVSAFVVNRFGYRPAVAALCFFYACAFVILSFDKTDSYWSLFSALPVFGLGDANGAGIVLALISDLVPRPTIGATRVFLDAGVMVGPLLTGVMSHTMSLQKCCWVLAVWSLLTMGFAFWLLKEDVGKEDHHHHHQDGHQQQQPGEKQQQP